MTKGLWIYLVILLLLATGIDTLVLKTEYLPSATTQNFSTSSSRNIFVNGNTGLIDVTTASSGYFRVRSGDAVAEGEHITGKYFQNVTQLPIGQWDIEDGDFISFTAVSQNPISVTLVANADLYLATILYTLLLSAGFFLFGMVITDS